MLDSRFMRRSLRRRMFAARGELYICVAVVFILAVGRHVTGETHESLYHRPKLHERWTQRNAQAFQNSSVSPGGFLARLLNNVDVEIILMKVWTCLGKFESSAHDMAGV